MIEENKKIRVLIVDDSFFMRKLLIEILSSSNEIEVIGSAKNGLEAISEAKRLKPDVITMDYQMPNMNGAQATEEILKDSESFPAVIMLSAFTKEEAEETFESLRAGAVDFIVKPSGELSLDINKLKDKIIARIKMAAMAHVKKRKVLDEIVQKSFIKGKKRDDDIEESSVKIVVIGASTGGPPVIEDIIITFSQNFSAPILIVQHMPEHFTKSFAERLNKVSKIPVKEAEEGDLVRAGQIFIAPGGFHMKVQKRDDNKLEKFIHLTKEPAIHGLRPSIDVLMNSVAHNYVNQIIGVILTGMGSDGMEGMRAIKTVYGHTIVQAPETAVIDSMPRAVIDSGLADYILPPEEIMKKIVELSRL
ncbi:MAG: chemotaxis response regulator protein-glutamate methylesterase [Patescibacteria group bacterium]